MKKVLSILLVLVLTLPLFGFHDNSGLPDFVIPDTFDTSKDYNIVFWAKNDTNKKQVAIYNQAKEEFEKLYPNIHIQIKFYTDYNRMYQDVITNLSTNTTPNVCITYPDHIATYLTNKNSTVPLDELINHPKYGFSGSEIKINEGNSLPKVDDEILNKFLQEGLLDGKYYDLPFMRSTEAIYINATYVDELLKTNKDLKEKYKNYNWRDEVLTWQFVFDVSQAAVDTYDSNTETYSINNQKIMIPFIYKSTDNMMIQMLAQMDNSLNNYSDESGNIKLFGDDAKSILQLISPYADTKAFSTFTISSYPGNFLNAGQCIFGIDSTAGATWMGSKAPLQDIHESSIVDFETVIKMVPQFDVDNPKMISQGPSICIFNKQDNQTVLASWLFAQFLLTNQIQIGYSQTEGYLPVTSCAINSKEYQDYISKCGQADIVDGKETGLYYDIKIKASQILKDAQDNNQLFTTDVFNGSASLRQASGSLIDETVKAIRRNETETYQNDPEGFNKFVDELYVRIIQLNHLDQIGSQANQKQTFGPLPKESIYLIEVIGIAWVGIITVKLIQKFKKHS